MDNQNRMLQIANNLQLPPEAVTETFGILARRGAGKTYTAKVLVEEMVKCRFPVVVLDPVGAWWGLRFGADGKTPGLPVVILGGQHGDVSLEATGGRVIADLVVDEPRPMVLDLSDFNSNAEQDRFVADFADQLYRRKAKSPGALHIVLDEADSFAPQRPMPGQQRMLGAIEALVRRGRQRGIGCTFITQRPAVLNKNVLTQIEVLVTLQMTAPQDRAAIDDWVRGNGTPEQRDELMSSLASLGRGHAWFWSPSRFDLFERVHVRKLETFDSSATPEAGAVAVQPHSAASVDLEALRERLAATIEESQNSDPKTLREEIKRLEKELKARPVEMKIEIHEVPVLANGEVERLENQAHDLIALSKDLHGLGTQILNRLEGFNPPSSGVEVLLMPATSDAPPAKVPTPKNVEIVPPVPKVPETKTAPATPLQSLGASQRAILTVLSQYPKGRSKMQIALLTGYSVNGGSFGATFGILKRADWIGGTPALYFITGGGKRILGPVAPLPTGAALRSRWYSQLNTCEAAILRILSDVHPKSLSKSQIAGKTGYEAKGGSFGTAISRLRALELIEGKTEMKMDDALA